MTELPTFCGAANPTYLYVHGESSARPLAEATRSEEDRCGDVIELPPGSPEKTMMCSNCVSDLKKAGILW